MTPKLLSSPIFRFAVTCVLIFSPLLAQDSTDAIAPDEVAVEDPTIVLEATIAELEARLQSLADSLENKVSQIAELAAQAEAQATENGLLIDSLTNVSASLQASTESGESLSTALEASTADIATQVEKISNLQDSLSQNIQMGIQRAAVHESLLVAGKSEYKHLSDSLTVVSVLFKASETSSRKQILEISTLEGTVSSKEAFNLNLQARHDSVNTLSDSLRMVLGASYDSLTNVHHLKDSTTAVSADQFSQIGSLTDSLGTSTGREVKLQAEYDALSGTKDSIGLVLDQAKLDLIAAANVDASQSDAIAALEVLFTEVGRKLSANGSELNDIYGQMQAAIFAANGPERDPASDARYLGHLQSVVDYKSGSGRRMFGGGDSDLMKLYKIEEFRLYFEWSALRGNSPEALNLLADAYYGQKDEIRGPLTYLKTIFLYSGTAASDSAIVQIRARIKGDGEIKSLFENVAINPDSMDVGLEPVYRYFHFLDNIRFLSDPVAQAYFQEQANLYLTIYPNVYGSDHLALWIAESYHDLGEFNTEVVALAKIGSMFPGSKLIPESQFSIASVTANDLGQHELGAEKFGRLWVDFPNHSLAPSAMMAQGKLNEGELKQPTVARDLYRKLTDTYPDDVLAPVALSNLAKLLDANLKQASAAIVVYEELLEKYGKKHPSDGVDALNGLGKISMAAKQYDAAVVHFLDIHKRYPSRTAAVIAGLLSAADIYESSLKDLNGAIQSLRIIVDEYPKYDKVKAVQKRITKLEKKRG